MHAMSTCVIVRHRMLTSDTADAKLYATYVVVNGHNCVAVRCHTRTDGSATHAVLPQSTYEDAVCVNFVIEINMLDYNIAIRQCMATYGAARGANRT